jgi:hypothetical protein
MRQTANIAPTPPIQISAGQEWRPRSKQTPGITRVRIVCRYPFATADDGAMWVIEHMDVVQKLERVSERTLVQLWYLAADVPTP